MPRVPQWKRFEAALARAVGTTRIPVTGERDGADFETPMFIYQAKHRAGEFPVTVARWLERVVARAEAEALGKIGVVVIQKPRAAYADAIVVLRWKDWLDLHGSRQLELPPERTPPPDAGILFR